MSDLPPENLPEYRAIVSGPTWSTRQHPPSNASQYFVAKSDLATRGQEIDQIRDTRTSFLFVLRLDPAYVFWISY